MMRIARRAGGEAAAISLLGAALLAGLACERPDPGQPRSFDTPQEASQALIEVLESSDVPATLALFGSQYADRIVTADWDAEREARLEIAKAAREQTEIAPAGEGAVELQFGEDAWPFPVQLVKIDGAWQFDTDEGIEEILDRRIGRNELSAIALARSYVDAQIEYARADRDEDDVLEYAQRLASSPGERDGLYWEAGPDEEPSPFGPLVKGAERYLDTLEPGDPIRGYYFQVLTRQGENAPGGAYDYVINGNMIAGFALVAYPADYGSTGVMTFAVNHQGRVYQKDQGPFAGMQAYDPDDTWKPVAD